MSWAAITAIGTVLAGLALPLAFIQLRALRQDRLRGQVSKVGAWTGVPEPLGGILGSWTIPILVRNSSELPVRVNTVDLAVRPWGYDRVLAVPEDTSEPGYYMDKRFGKSGRTCILPGTIAPGDTWSTGWTYDYEPEADFDEPQPPMASVTRLVVTDTAGYQWEMRSDRAGPAPRVQRWRRWWWKRHGNL
jgi:hypothetical protein